MSVAPYQLCPPPSDAEFAELASSIADLGVLVPVLVDDEGNVLDGHHRQRIADDLGIDYPVEVKAGLTDAEKRTIALSLNVHRRHLDRDQKRAIIAASLTADPELSDRQHAERTGASDKTVGTVRKELEATAEIPQLKKRTGADGKKRSKRKPVTAADVADEADTQQAPKLADGEADAIADTVNDSDVDLPTAIAGNAESKKIPTKPDLGGGVSHPARYSEGLIAAFAAILDELGGITEVIDPFAGTGRIHQLLDHNYNTTGIEIEPEWAQMHARTITGSALAIPFPDDSFEAVVTSPTYGNRLADSHNASDPERRRSYTHDLGRPLSTDNSGAMQWGDDYRTFHIAAWTEARRVLIDGGHLLLNIKDHIRNGRRQMVPAWHLETLLGLGFNYLWHEDVATPSMRAGANGEARIAAETIFVMGLDK